MLDSMMNDMDSRLLDNLVTTVVLLCVTLSWLVLRRTKKMSRLLARYLWIDTAANLVIIPLRHIGSRATVDEGA